MIFGWPRPKRANIPLSLDLDCGIVRLFERAQIDFRDMFTQEVMTYESNIAYTLRFMIDTKVSRIERYTLESPC